MLALRKHLHSLDTRTKILAALAVPLVFMVLIAVVVQRGINVLVETSRWVQHTQLVIADGQELSKLMVDMETGERGFLITGKDSFLEPYLASQDAWDQKLASLVALVDDNPDQAARLLRVDKLQKQWLAEPAASEIAKRRSVPDADKSLTYMQQVLKRKVGKEILDELRLILENLKTDLERSRNRRAVNLVIALSKDIVDQETGERGFLITGTDNFLEPYHRGYREFRLHLSELRKLVEAADDTADMLNTLSQVEATITKWQEQIAAPEIALRHQVNAGDRIHDDLTKIVAASQGKRLLDELRTLLAKLEHGYERAENTAGQALVLAIAKDIVNQESGERGFLLTGRLEFLQPYEQGKAALGEHLEAMADLLTSTLTKDQVLLQLDALSAKTEEWKRVAAEPEIRARREIAEAREAPLALAQRELRRRNAGSELRELRRSVSELDSSSVGRAHRQAQVLSMQMLASVSEIENLLAQFMITGDETISARLHDQDLAFDEVIVAATVLASSEFEAEQRSHVLGVVDAIRDHKRDWVDRTITPVLMEERQFGELEVTTRQFIQEVLVRAKGKSILDEMRTIFETLRVAFEEEQHLEGVGLVLDLAKAMVDQETGQRGFLITGDESFLAPFHSGREDFAAEIPRLKLLIDSYYDPVIIHARIDEIEKLATRWRTEAGETEIALRRGVGENGVTIENIQDLLAQGHGKVLMDRQRRVLDQLDQFFAESSKASAQFLVASILKDVVDQETGQRGFLLTGIETFLEPYHDGAEALALHLAQLRTLVGTGFDKTDLLQLVERLRLLQEDWLLQAARPEIALRREINNSAASMADVTALIESETGKKIIDEIRAELADFISVETDLMESRTKEATEATSVAITLINSSTLVAILLALLVAFAVSGAIVRRLHQLVEATRSVAAGDYSHASLEESDDEIGTLAASFNTMTKALDTSRTELKKASAIKGDFLAHMSHEIRTPMNGVVGVLDLLKETSLNEDQSQLVKTMQTSSSSLLTIINDILDYSKIESGMMVFTRTRLDLGKLLDNVVYLYDGKASQKGLELTSSLKSENARFVLGDEVRIMQILNNLVSNAIKFTSRGAVTLEARCTSSEQSQLSICFSVQDSGIGIAPEALDDVFKDFVQVDNSTTRRFGGTGLGLSISHKLTTLMNGRLWLESTLGVGTTFYCELPLESADAPVATELKATQVDAEDAPKARESFSDLRVLLVEDNEVNQFVARSMLAKLGCEVETAANGQLAVDLCRERDFQIVFMDCQMPVMDGFTATRALREHEQDGAHVPIIALTANAMQEDRERCLAAGMDDYLAKPIRIQALHEALSKWTPKRETVPPVGIASN